MLELSARVQDFEKDNSWMCDHSAISYLYVAMFTARHMFNVAEYGMCSAVLLYNIMPQLEIKIHFWQTWIEIEY